MNKLPSSTKVARVGSDMRSGNLSTAQQAADEIAQERDDTEPPRPAGTCPKCGCGRYSGSMRFTSISADEAVKQCTCVSCGLVFSELYRRMPDRVHVHGGQGHDPDAVRVLDDD